MANGQTKLEIAAINARLALLPRNMYNGSNPANSYSATHTRAKSDTETPKQGRGTGGFLDIENYEGGNAFDKKGIPNQAGSGRDSQITLNLATWGYGPRKHYTKPNTSGNSGQVTI